MSLFTVRKCSPSLSIFFTFLSLSIHFSLFFLSLFSFVPYVSYSNVFEHIEYILFSCLCFFEPLDEDFYLILLQPMVCIFNAIFLFSMSLPPLDCKTIENKISFFYYLKFRASIIKRQFFLLMHYLPI